MFKIVCLFAVLSVALGNTVPISPSGVPVRIARSVQEMDINEPLVNDQIPADASQLSPDDMDKAETFGFGYHKHIYAVPRYYGYHGGYGGYYPYHGYNYGYPHYY